MAHADYNCCACCDCKMEYRGDDAQTKENICQNCVQDLNRNGVKVFNFDQFWEWINTVSKEDFTRIAKAVGFSKCLYANAVDELVEEKFRNDKEDDKC